MDPLTVLVVEDEASARSWSSATLRTAGFKILEACDGQHALELMETFLPDVILTDLNMPRMNGNEMVGRIRRDAKLRGIPIVVLSEAEPIDLLKEALEVQLILIKPIGEYELCQKIRSVLRLL